MISDATINDKERSALKLFREQISDLVENMDSFEKHDLSLLRWLRARELNIVKAEEMLRKALHWRQENKIDSILQTWKAPPIFDRELPLKVCGVDKDGCVICLKPYGRWDLRGVVEKGHGSDYVTFWTQFLEQGTAFMKKESLGRKEPITQFVLIYDLEGFAMRQIISKEKVTAELNVMKLFEANYPETLKACYIVNAPKIFEILFAFFKPILTGHTLSKVKVFGSNTQEWREALLSNIEPAELPSDYGGTNTSCTNYSLSVGLDWLARGKPLPNEVLKNILIPAGQKINIEIPVEQTGVRINWNFKCEGYDIGFEFNFKGNTLYSCRRCDAHLNLQVGTHPVTETGVYTIVFDNSFSKFRSKNLQYAYTVSNENNN